jgi:hypothetical protein
MSVGPCSRAARHPRDVAWAGRQGRRGHAARGDGPSVVHVAEVSALTAVWDARDRRAACCAGTGGCRDRAHSCMTRSRHFGGAGAAVVWPARLLLATMPHCDLRHRGARCIGVRYSLAQPAGTRHGGA